MKKIAQKMLLALFIALFIVNVFSISMVRAQESIGNYANVDAKQLIELINNSADEGESIFSDAGNDNSVKSAGSNKGGKTSSYASQTDTSVMCCPYYYGLSLDKNEVYVGETVTATATTNNPGVTSVIFIWIWLWNFKIKQIDNKPVGTAQSTCNPDTEGKWKVVALFIGEGGCKPRLYAVRWTCFRVKRLQQVIPDFPVVGTAGAMTAMLLGLGLFLNKKRQSPI